MLPRLRGAARRSRQTKTAAPRPALARRDGGINDERWPDITFKEKEEGRCNRKNAGSPSREWRPRALIVYRPLLKINDTSRVISSRVVRFQTPPTINRRGGQPVLASLPQNCRSSRTFTLSASFRAVLHARNHLDYRFSLTADDQVTNCLMPLSLTTSL